jgi:hypothetical protein
MPVIYHSECPSQGRTEPLGTTLGKPLPILLFETLDKTSKHLAETKLYIANVFIDLCNLHYGKE